MARRRSIYKDKNDMNQFRHHRDRSLGFSVSNEYYQQTPFFFTRECAQLNMVGQYKGASAFLICNGPSLVSGDYDLSLLKSPGIMTYGMNNGPATIRPNLWSCVDDPQRFLKSIWLDPTITKIVPHAHAEKPIFDNEKWEEVKEGGKKVLVGECPNCVFFHRNDKFEESRWLFEDKINWGNHGNFGGGRSVMMPVIRILFLLGFRNVYLMGADFNMSETSTYHFDEQRAKGAVKCNMNTYKRMKEEYFPKLKPYFEEEGFNIYNCNPDSKLGFDLFPFVSYADAIAQATNPMGGVGNERTWGMYSKPADKEQWREEPEEDKKKHLKAIENRPSSPISNGIKVVRDTPVPPPPINVQQEPVVRQPQVQQVVAVVNDEGDVVETQVPQVPIIPRVIQTETTRSSSPSVVRTETVTPVVQEIQKTPKVVPAQGTLIKSLPCRT